MFEIIVFLLLGLILLIWIGYFILAMRNYYQLPRLTDTPSRRSSQQLPPVSVIVPTRNEAYRVEKCIRSLKAQTYPHLEIFIVDDSTDNTLELIKSIIGEDQRFTLIKQEKLPDGWIGKPFALQQGSKLAKGEFLLFIDADTFHDPMLITRAVEYAQDHDTDLLSLVPHNALESFWEKLIQPIPLTFISAGMPLAKVNKPDSKIGIAFGPFMLIKHAVFDNIGGYETIKNRIADDVEMGKLVKDSGYKVGLINGQTMMHVRMYENFHEIWEGWSKNIFFGPVQKRGINSKVQRLLIVLLGIGVIFGLMVFPLCATIITLLLALVTHAPQWQWVFLFTFIVWLTGIILQSLIQKAYRYGEPKYAILLSLASLIMIAIFVNSAIKTMSGAGVTWKGRTYTEKKS
jgi:chlorobactene glucosyltransferase